MSQNNMISLALSVPSVDSLITNLQKAQQTLPNLERAVADSSLIIQQTWANYASGVRVEYSGGSFVIHDPMGSYARSIERQVPYRGRLSGLVFSTSDRAEKIEEGTPPYDMKPAFLRSAKAKTGKNGSRYLTIPFRHNTPSAGATGASMPRSVYNQARKLDFSSITGRSPWGTFTYAWGGRLPDSSLGQRSKTQVGGMTAPYTWSTGIYSGMVRMGNQGGKRSTGYLTFRRVSSNSDPNSWWHPGTPAKPIRQAVIEATEPQVLQLLRTGFALDLAMAGLPIPPDLR